MLRILVFVVVLRMYGVAITQGFAERKAALREEASSQDGLGTRMGYKCTINGLEIQ